MLVTDAMKANLNFQPCYGASMRRKDSGFTLIELLITVTIAAVLMTIALPSLRTFVENQRVKTAAFDIQSALILARSEAIKRNALVTITPAGGTNWKNGWTITSGGSTIAQQDLYKSATLTMSGPATVVYQGNGRLSTSVTGITVSSTATTRASSITIDLSGVPKATSHL